MLISASFSMLNCRSMFSVYSTVHSWHIFLMEYSVYTMHMTSQGKTYVKILYARSAVQCSLHFVPLLHCSVGMVHH